MDILHRRYRPIDKWISSWRPRAPHALTRAAPADYDLTTTAELRTEAEVV